MIYKDLKIINNISKPHNTDFAQFISVFSSIFYFWSTHIGFLKNKLFLYTFEKGINQSYFLEMYYLRDAVATIL